jgi:hypothetical protein
MHFHLPKPLHGWREFAGEVGIIVLGVLIALSAEQAVEWFHWQARVGEAEAAIGRDLALTSDVASERIAVARCSDDRLAVLRSAILSSGDRWDTALPEATDGMSFRNHVYLVPARLWNTQVWDSLVADGTVAHFDPERTRSYALLYHTIGLLAVDNQDELNAEPALTVLGDRDIELSGDAKLGLIRIIDALRNKNRLIAATSRQILRRIQDSGHLPSLYDTKRRLADPTSRALECQYSEAALKDRIAQGWFTLHR